MMLGLASPLAAQLHEFNNTDRARGRAMLHAVSEDLGDHFWDTTLVGPAFTARVAAADSAIAQATNYGEINLAIMRVLMSLETAGTRFLPPSGVNSVRFGWTPYPIGDSVYLRDVPPKLTAPPYGLRTGDRLVAIDGWQVERRRLLDFSYLRRLIQKQDSLLLRVEREGEAPRDVRIPTEVVQGRSYYDLSRLGEGSDFFQLIREAESADSGWDSRFAEPAPDVIYWRLRTMSVSSDHMRAGLRRARRHSTLILDLRGAGGGNVPSSMVLVGNLARAEQAGDTLYLLRKRDRTEAEVLERGDEGLRWRGRLLVLVDGSSMSVAEVVADAVQRLGLGSVLGDRTAGFLSLTTGYRHITTGGTSLLYGSMISIAAVERPDGTRVEGTGIIPDEVVQPTPDDLLARRDPVLARALQIAGLPYDPVKAMEYYRVGEDQTEDR